MQKQLPPGPSLPLLRGFTTVEIAEVDILHEDSVVEMTPHSMAHRDRQIADHPDDPAVVPHDPDGVSHAVVGVTAVAAVFFAMLVAMLLITGTWTGRIGAVLLVIVGIPLLIRRFAERDARATGDGIGGVDVNA